jgi:hypothetical protein
VMRCRPPNRCWLAAIRLSSRAPKHRAPRFCVTQRHALAPVGLTRDTEVTKRDEGSRGLAQLLVAISVMRDRGLVKSALCVARDLSITQLLLNLTVIDKAFLIERNHRNAFAL